MCKHCTYWRYMLGKIRSLWPPATFRQAAQVSRATRTLWPATGRNRSAPASVVGETAPSDFLPAADFRPVSARQWPRSAGCGGRDRLRPVGGVRCRAHAASCRHGGGASGDRGHGRFSCCPAVRGPQEVIAIGHRKRHGAGRANLGAAPRQGGPAEMLGLAGDQRPNGRGRSEHVLKRHDRTHGRQVNRAVRAAIGQRWRPSVRASPRSQST